MRRSWFGFVRLKSRYCTWCIARNITHTQCFEYRKKMTSGNCLLITFIDPWEVRSADRVEMMITCSVIGRATVWNHSKQNSEALNESRVGYGSFLGDKNHVIVNIFLEKFNNQIELSTRQGRVHCSGQCSQQNVSRLKKSCQDRLRLLTLMTERSNKDRTTVIM